MPQVVFRCGNYEDVLGWEIMTVPHEKQAMAFVSTAPKAPNCLRLRAIPQPYSSLMLEEAQHQTDVVPPEAHVPAIAEQMGVGDGLLMSPRSTPVTISLGKRPCTPIAPRRRPTI